MKKAAVVICSVFIFSNLSFAIPPGSNPDGKGVSPNKRERNARMMEMRKDYIEFHEKLDPLLDKYHKANDDQKEAIGKEIKTLVSEQTEKELIKKKEMLVIQKERIADFEKRINEIENDKEAYINKKIDYCISEEGRKRIKEKSIEFKNREQNREKNSWKKDKKDEKKYRKEKR